MSHLLQHQNTYYIFFIKLPANIVFFVPHLLYFVPELIRVIIIGLAYWGLGLALLGQRSQRNALLTGTPYNNGYGKTRDEIAYLFVYIYIHTSLLLLPFLSHFSSFCPVFFFLFFQQKPCRHVVFDGIY